MFKRGEFGVEYNPRQAERKSSGLGWLFALVAVVATISLGWTLIARWRAASSDELPIEPPPPAEVAPEAPPPVASVQPPVIRPADTVSRPHALRSLLMRLEEALKSRNLELEVTTIESIRALPGSPAADLDDSLARRLGALNMIRLFDRRNEQWVRKVTVKRGDMAERIAVENGSTLRSLVRLNGGRLPKLKRGDRLYVMDHPHFNLVLHKRAAVADLFLDGRFFKRYDLPKALSARNGQYEAKGGFPELCRQLKLEFKSADRDELEMLLPRGTLVLVAEI